jgi:hypothetical protein
MVFPLWVLLISIYISEYNYQFPLGNKGSSVRCSQGSSTTCGSRLRLLASRAHDDVVAHVAAGGGDTRSYAGRL